MLTITFYSWLLIGGGDAEATPTQGDGSYHNGNFIVILSQNIKKVFKFIIKCWIITLLITHITV